MDPTAPRVFAAVMRRDLLLGARHRSELVNPLVFYFITVFLFGIALGPERAALAETTAAIAWVAVLLASTMALNGMFESDFEDGSLEHLLLAPTSLTVLVAAKVAAHWLTCSLPLIAAATLAAFLLDLPPAAVGVLAATLLLGTPVLSLNGAVLAALTVGLRGGGLLLALLILPLCVPVLVFSVGAVAAAAQGFPAAAELYILGALFVLAATIMPPAAAASLRVRLN
jgi:heme exporter protein B